MEYTFIDEIQDRQFWHRIDDKRYLFNPSARMKKHAIGMALRLKRANEKHKSTKNK